MKLGGSHGVNWNLMMIFAANVLSVGLHWTGLGETEKFLRI